MTRKAQGDRLMVSQLALNGRLVALLHDGNDDR
jgi:hypothetical protein